MIKFIFYFIIIIFTLQFILYYNNVDIYDLYDKPTPQKPIETKDINNDIVDLKNTINQLKKINQLIYSNTNGENHGTQI